MLSELCDSIGDAWDVLTALRLSHTMRSVMCQARPMVHVLGLHVQTRASMAVSSMDEGH